MERYSVRHNDYVLCTTKDNSKQVLAGMWLPGTSSGRSFQWAKAPATNQLQENGFSSTKPFGTQGNARDTPRSQEFSSLCTTARH